LTVPDGFPGYEIYEYLYWFHPGPENPVRVQDLIDDLEFYFYLTVDERRLREWLETQEEYPITSSGYGYWCCTCKRDWYPAIRFSVKCFLAWKRRWERQHVMMKLHHPKHGRLFDINKYRKVA